MNPLGPAILTSLKRGETARGVALGITTVVALFAWGSFGYALQAHAHVGCLASCTALGGATTLLGLYLVYRGRKPFHLTQTQECLETSAKELEDDDYAYIYVFQHHLMEETSSVTVSRDAVGHLPNMRALTKRAGCFTCADDVPPGVREDMRVQYGAEKIAFVKNYDPSLIKHLLETCQTQDKGVNLFEIGGKKYIEMIDHLRLETGEYVMRRRTVSLNEKEGSSMNVEYSLPLERPKTDLPSYFTKN